MLITIKACCSKYFNKDKDSALRSSASTVPMKHHTITTACPKIYCIKKWNEKLKYYSKLSKP